MVIGSRLIPSLLDSWAGPKGFITRDVLSSPFLDTKVAVCCSGSSFSASANRCVCSLSSVLVTSRVSTSSITSCLILSLLGLGISYVVFLRWYSFLDCEDLDSTSSSAAGAVAPRAEGSACPDSALALDRFSPAASLHLAAGSVGDNYQGVNVAKLSDDLVMRPGSCSEGLPALTSNTPFAPATGTSPFLMGLGEFLLILFNIDFLCCFSVSLVPL